MSKCVKCRSSDRIGGDTWCAGCSAWEVIGKELTGRWSGPTGLRAVADSLVLGTAREVRALRALGAGFGRASKESGSEPAAAKEPAEGGAGSHRAPPGLAAKSQAKPPEPEEEGESYTYETDTEEGAPAAEEKKEKSGSARDTPRKSRQEEEEAPPLKRIKHEEKSPERKEEKKRRSEEKDKKKRDRSRGRSRDREAAEEPPREEGEKKKKKKKNKRAGRKHQRLARLAENPYTPVHRGLPDSYLAPHPLDDRKERKYR